MPVFDPKKFAVSETQPIPIVMLLDISSSMGGEKINSLNKAVKEMIVSFANEMGEFSTVISIFSFGGDAKCLYDPPYKKSSEIEWNDLAVSGDTPMGKALKKAKELVEDKEATKGKWYRPTVILVSDGQPTDDWGKHMTAFIKEGRSSKCDRMAMAIGQGADENVLRQFIAGTENQLFYAHNAKDIKSFFKLVFMSISKRSRSSNPNMLLLPPPLEKENTSNDYDDFF